MKFRIASGYSHLAQFGQGGIRVGLGVATDLGDFKNLRGTRMTRMKPGMKRIGEIDFF
jgi:hypothetical protein